MAPNRRPELTDEDRKVGRIVYLCLWFLVISTVYSCTAHVVHGEPRAYPYSAWYEGLEQPDSGYSKSGAKNHWECCGFCDGYQADIYDISGYQNGRKDCVAQITDGSPMTCPDGSTRLPLKNGTIIHFPCSKVNPLSDGNPTGHAMIFLDVSRWKPNTVEGTYCFVQLPPGS